MSRDADIVGHQRQQDQIENSAKRILGNEEVDQDARDLANKALGKIEAHEGVNMERYNHTKASLERLEQLIEAMKRSFDNMIGRVPAGIIAGLTGLCGWLAARAFPLH